MSRLDKRRYDPENGYTHDQAHELAALSRLISRQIGLLIDRQGKVEIVIIGTAKGILIPELARERSTSGRLRGLRLLHTHLTDTPLSSEDLMDLLFLRLDSVGVLTVDAHGVPVSFQSAHLLPHQVADVAEAQGWTHKKKANKKAQETIGVVENDSFVVQTINPEILDLANAIDEIAKSMHYEVPTEMISSAIDEALNTENSDSDDNNISEESKSDKTSLTSANIKYILNKELHRENAPVGKKETLLSDDAQGQAQREELGQEQDPTKEPYIVSAFMPWDKVQNDFVAEIEALEEEFARLIRTNRPQANVQKIAKKGKIETLQSGARAILVSVSKAPKSIQEANLVELAELAKTAGLVIAGSLVQRITKIHPRQILSQTKLAELEVIALQGHAGIIIFDGELSPAQLHNLAELTERKLLDRTQLILDIFAQHAKTGAGKLQVEMAQLKYTQPRLAGKNRGMDRLAGGIGGRGPGETKLETDRRRVRERIARINNELETLKKQRAANRARRSKQELPVAAIVGYTNAGKSTLLNRLTKSDVIAENKLFATLDPTTRRLYFRKDREIVLADTVGFIRDLPKELIEAFRATLEELNEADLLIHMLDASHPEKEQQLEAVEAILNDLKLQDIPCLLFLNKWDDVDPTERIALMERFPKALPISALTGLGLNMAVKQVESLLFSVNEKR